MVIAGRGIGQGVSWLYQGETLVKGYHGYIRVRHWSRGIVVISGRGIGQGVSLV